MERNRAMCSPLLFTHLRLTIRIGDEVVLVPNDHQAEIAMIEALQNLISHRSAVLKRNESQIVIASCLVPFPETLFLGSLSARRACVNRKFVFNISMPSEDCIVCAPYSPFREFYYIFSFLRRSAVHGWVELLFPSVARDRGRSKSKHHELKGEMYTWKAYRVQPATSSGNNGAAFSIIVWQNASARSDWQKSFQSHCTYRTRNTK